MQDLGNLEAEEIIEDFFAFQAAACTGRPGCPCGRPDSHPVHVERRKPTATEAVAALTADALGGELYSFEPRGVGGVAVIVIGSTFWRVQLDPLPSREAS